MTVTSIFEVHIGREVSYEIRAVLGVALTALMGVSSLFLNLGWISYATPVAVAVMAPYYFFSEEKTSIFRQSKANVDLKVTATTSTTGQEEEAVDEAFLDHEEQKELLGSFGPTPQKV